MGRFQRRSRVLFWRLRRALASGCEGRTRRLCRSTEKSWSNCLKSNQRSLVSPKNSCTNAINYFFFKIKLIVFICPRCISIRALAPWSYHRWGSLDFLPATLYHGKDSNPHQWSYSSVRDVALPTELGVYLLGQVFS